MSATIKKHEQEVYRITRFSDAIESPVFSLILVLTFILGISSIFGFLQNPLKLKSVVDVINKKVAIYNTSDSQSRNLQAVTENKYSVLYNFSSSSVSPNFEGTDNEINTSRYALLSNNLRLVSFAEGAIKPVLFDYDITSEQFWGNLTLDILDSDSTSQSVGVQFLGAPLKKKFTLESGDSKYSMNDSLRKNFTSL